MKTTISKIALAGLAFTSLSGVAYAATAGADLDINLIVTNDASFPNSQVSVYQFPSCEVNVDPLDFDDSSLLSSGVTAVTSLNVT